jgi:hypothetical protein
LTKESTFQTKVSFLKTRRNCRVAKAHGFDLVYRSVEQKKSDELQLLTMFLAVSAIVIPYYSMLFCVI